MALLGCATGPVYRVETRFLHDGALSDEELATHVEHVFDNNFSGGCAMDSLGNLYFSETTTHNIRILSPSGRSAVLVASPESIRPDGTFIGHARRLYIPVKQPVNEEAMPFTIFRLIYRRGSV